MGGKGLLTTGRTLILSSGGSDPGRGEKEGEKEGAPWERSRLDQPFPSQLGDKKPEVSFQHSAPRNVPTQLSDLGFHLKSVGLLAGRPTPCGGVSNAKKVLEMNE